MSVLKSKRKECKAEFVNETYHNRVLKLRRIFHSIYGFSSEHISEFRHRDKKEEEKDAVHSA